MTISERLFAAMAEKGITQADICREFGLGSSVPYNWKTRNTDPPAKLILPICGLLGVSVEWLLTGEDPADPGQKETAPAPVLDDRSRELLEIFGSLDDFDQGRLMERAKDLKEAASKKQERLSGSAVGSLAG